MRRRLTAFTLTVAVLAALLPVVGLQWGGVSRAAASGQSGVVLAIGSGRLVRIDPSTLATAPLAPLPYIDQLGVSGMAVDPIKHLAYTYVNGPTFSTDGIEHFLGIDTDTGSVQTDIAQNLETVRSGPLGYAFGDSHPWGLVFDAKAGVIRGLITYGPANGAKTWTSVTIDPATGIVTAGVGPGYDRYTNLTYRYATIDPGSGSYYLSYNLNPPHLLALNSAGYRDVPLTTLNQFRGPAFDTSSGLVVGIAQDKSSGNGIWHLTTFDPVWGTTTMLPPPLAGYPCCSDDQGAIDPIGHRYFNTSWDNQALSYHLFALDTQTGSLLATGPVGGFTDFVFAAAVDVNQPPVVNAGPAVRGHSNQPVTLAGTVSDDGLPNPPGTLTSAWTLVSSPTAATVTFGNPASPSTTATFSRPGHYVLQLSASDSILTASATTTADIVDTYGIRTRSWIPQPAVVDPVEPISLPYRVSELLASVDPNCWTPPNSQVNHTQVSSTFFGDSHAAFEGGYRMQDVVTFDWDGQTVSNLQTVPTEGHVGATVRNKVYADTRTGNILASCSQTGVAADTTSSSASGTSFTVSYRGRNPLTPQVGTPEFVNDVVGQLKSDGSVALSYTVTQFPSAGLQVLVNGGPILTGLENDVSCLSNSAVLGIGGAIVLARGLNTTSSGTATAIPNTHNTFGTRSSLCP